MLDLLLVPSHVPDFSEISTKCKYLERDTITSVKIP